MSKLISIIIPVYNAGNTIKRCIDSILNQTISNYEVILVDDGSTDGSGEICDFYADIDERFVVIHKENGGVSSARNTGLQAANGDYIAFIDADDFVSSEFIAVLMLQDDEDLTIGSVYYVDPNGSIMSSAREEKSRVEDVNSANMLNWFEHGSLYSCWTSMFKRSIICQNKIEFDTKTTRGEDTIFMIEYVKYCKKIRFVSKYIYYYVLYGKNGSSSSRLTTNNVYALDYLDKYLDDWFTSIELHSDIFDSPEFWIKKESRGYMYDVIRNPEMSKEQKLKYFKLFYSLSMFSNIDKLFSSEIHIIRVIVKAGSPRLLLICSIVYCFFLRIKRSLIGQK